MPNYTAMAFQGFFKKNVLYFPGCFCKSFLPKVVANYEKILNSLGVEFLRLTDIEGCCGNPSLSSGFLETFNMLLDQNSEIIKNQRVHTLITNCPSCANVFTRYHNVKVEPIVTTLLENLDLLNKNYKDEEVTLHLCCDSNNKDVKILLQKIGFKVREDSGMCCGSHGLLKENSPKIADEIAKRNLKSIKTEKLIVSCPWCYKHLKENSKDIEVLELSEVLI